MRCSLAEKGNKMATEKRLIDANALMERLKFKRKISEVGLYRGLESAMAQCAKAPTVDAVEVVRCKDCKYSYDGVANLMCGRCGQNINGIRLGGVSVKAEHFCSYGERKDNEI